MSNRGARCGACDHVDRASIELAIANKVPIRVIGKRYGLHHDAVHRHGRNHMDATLRAQLMTRGRLSAAEIENMRVTESEGILTHLVATRARMYSYMDDAEQQDDYKAAAAIGEKVVKVCETIARLLGDLQTGTVNVTNNMMVMPEFHAFRTSLMQALRSHPEARADVVKALQHFQSAELPTAETDEERALAAPELAKARDVTRRSRAKAAIEGEAGRVDSGS